jgi:hypothetical protein
MPAEVSSGEGASREGKPGLPLRNRELHGWEDGSHRMMCFLLGSGWGDGRTFFGGWLPVLFVFLAAHCLATILSAGERQRHCMGP